MEAVLGFETDFLRLFPAPDVFFADFIPAEAGFFNEVFIFSPPEAFFAAVFFSAVFLTAPAADLETVFFEAVFLIPVFLIVFDFSIKNLSVGKTVKLVFQYVRRDRFVEH